MKDDKKLIVLYKDKSIKIKSPEKFEYSKSIKYVLTPILSYDTNSFIMLDPNKYMNFTKAHIKAVMQYCWYDYGNDQYYSRVFSTIDKDYTNIIEFYDALHSLNRLYYVDFITSTAMDYNTFNMIDLSEIEITIYKKKEVTYHKYINHSNRKGPLEDPLELNLLQMLNQLNEIYYPADDDLKKHKLLVMDYANMMWDIRSDIHNSNLIYGMRLFHTASIYFMEDNTLSCLDNIGRALVEQKVVDASHDYSVKNFAYITEEEVNDFDVYEDYIYHIDFKYNDIIEYVLYLKMIYMNMILIYSDFIFDSDEDITHFDIITHLILQNSYTGKETYLLFNRDHIPTIVDFFKNIIGAWGD